MDFKKEYEDLNKQIKYREEIGCHHYGCSYCSDEKICRRIQYLEKYHKDEIKKWYYFFEYNLERLRNNNERVDSWIFSW